MRYTKIITLTGSGVSGSVRIESMGGRTTAAVKIRQPLPQKPVLFLLFGERWERTELSDGLTGLSDPATEADAALLAVNDRGALRFIAEGKSLGCRTDLEKVKQDIRMRELPVKRAVPAAEKLSLKAVADGERKKPAQEAPLAAKTADDATPAAPLFETREEKEAPAAEEPAPKRSALTSVRLPVRRKRSIRDLGQNSPAEAEAGSAAGDSAAEAPPAEGPESAVPEGGEYGPIENLTDTAPAKNDLEAPAGQEEETPAEKTGVFEAPAASETEESGTTDSDADGMTPDETNGAAGAPEAESSAPDEEAGYETEPASLDPLKKADPRDDKIIKPAPPPETHRSRALTDILDQARELFPSGYDRPAASREPAKEDAAKTGEQQKQKAAERRTPMQKNTKWDSEMEDVLRGAGKQKEKGAPRKPKQGGAAGSRNADPDSVPNPFPETFPNSKWRKVIYPGTTRYYLEGEAVGPNGKVQIAALPGEYSAVPPQRAKGFNRFIRAADGCGYWLRIMKR